MKVQSGKISSDFSDVQHNCAVVKVQSEKNSSDFSDVQLNCAYDKMWTPVQILKKPAPVKVDVLRGINVVDHQDLVQPRLENYESLHFIPLVPSPFEIFAKKLSIFLKEFFVIRRILVLARTNIIQYILAK